MRIDTQDKPLLLKKRSFTKSGRKFFCQRTRYQDDWDL